MNKIKCILVFLLMFMLLGCSKTKTSLSSDKFLSKMNELNLNVSEVKQPPDYAKKAYMLNGDIELTYIEGKTRYTIEGIYIDECRNILSIVDENYKKDVSNGDNWSKLTIHNNNDYYYIIWVDKTYILAKTTIDNKNKLNNIMKSIGY